MLETKLGNSLGNMKLNRNSSIELLRIFAMLMIIAMHYSNYGGVDKGVLFQEGKFINLFLVQITHTGHLGVDIFSLVFGYFNIHNFFKWSRILKMELQVWFYSAVIYLGLVLFGCLDMSYFELVKAIFPMLFREYWFASAYIILYVFSPFLNFLLLKLTKDNCKKFITLMLVLSSVVYTLTAQNIYTNEVLDLMLLYSIVAYFKIYPDNRANNKRSGYYLLVVNEVLIICSIVAFDILGMFKTEFASYATFFYNRISLLTIGCALGIFTLTINAREFYSNVINTVASSVFGIYLIHDNPYIRKILWQTILKTNEFYGTDKLLIHMIICVLIVFCVGCFIEIIRQNTIERVYIRQLKLFDKYSYKLYEEQIGKEL